MEKLPEFNLSDYKNMLSALLNAGYQFNVFQQIEVQKTNTKKCYLRHDIDLHLNKVDQISRIEYELDIRSTYFLLLSSLYNILEPNNKKIIQTILGQGHEIGLHYDLMEYPVHDMAACKEKLAFEMNMLERVFNTKIRSIVMHQPHTGMPDVFKEKSGFIHPHDPKWQTEMTYISDSCRAWRDEKLLDCFSASGPNVLQLNLHPELWLGRDKDRIHYLHSTLTDNMCDSTKQYINIVEEIWHNHEAAISHDKRNQHA